MGSLSRALLALLALVLIAAGGVSAWLFLYTGDLPNIEQLSEFAPTKAHLAAHDCLTGPSFVVPFDRIGKSFKDALTTADPSRSYPYQIARRLMCSKLESSARYQLDRLLHNLLPPEAERWCKPEYIISYGDVADKILEIESKTNPDLIVLGARPERGIHGAAPNLPIAAAQSVVARATCPVLTVRG